MRNVIQAHLICVLKLLRDKPSFPVRIALKRLSTVDRNQSYGTSITFGIASKDYALLEIDSWVDVFYMHSMTTCISCHEYGRNVLRVAAVVPQSPVAPIPVTEEESLQRQYGSLYR